MAMDREAARILVIVGDNIRAERSRRGLSQEQLARMTGLGTTQIARMERGESDSGISRHVRVAWALGIAPGVLFQDLDTPNGGA
jgi:transcriptional regulator with XRE-family HTH domain